MLFATATLAAPDANEPWRLRNAIGAPKWLELGLEHRSRFEHLANDPRTAHDSTGVFMRTLLSAGVHVGPVIVSAELQDSRAYATPGTPLTTTHVDAAELLQAFAGLRLSDVIQRGDHLSISAGRLTLDVGSRRLIARNEFRNTINGFTGLDASWTSARGDLLRLFAAMPVTRLPANVTSNAIVFDRENIDALTWGAFALAPIGDVQLEAYVIGLHERDGAVASSNRRLVTPGARLRRPVARGQLDFELEVMAQAGTSRASTAAADTTDLDHLAFAAHAETGYQLALPWSPRGVIQYDYASGDASPGDRADNRFDPLFGARRWELAPSGLYGALLRSNLNAAGLRLELTPHRTVDLFAAWRPAWLASPHDAWTAVGLRDASGDFIGHHLEARVRWQPFPRNLSFEAGGAALVPGSFVRSTALYFYGQLSGRL